LSEIAYHRPTTIACIRLAMVITAAALAAVIVAPESSSAGPGSTIVIRVKSVLVASQIVKDVPPKGASKGDVVTGRDNLLNVTRQFGKPSGARVGVDRVTETILSSTSAIIQGTAHLPDGTIAFKGTGKANSSTGTLTVPVVGGTGRYAHARGTVTAGTQATNVNVYRLTLP
jgi:hypothetical protein